MGINKKFIAVGILCFINLINYMDRYTVAGVLTDITAYYGLTDAQCGVLQTVFIVSYMFMAPCFGYLGDRYSRKYIMAFGVLFWSLFTFLGSLIPPSGWGWFLFLRAMVGIGEASYSTIAPTIIADYFVGGLRTQMLGVFFFAIPVGSGFGYIFANLLASGFGDWKYALRLTPVLGVISVAVLMVFMEEPTRGEADGALMDGDLVEKSNIKKDLIYLAKVPSFIWSTIGFTCICFITGSLAWWAPTFMKYIYMNRDGVANNGVTLIFGVITTIAGILGVIIGTYGAGLLRRRTERADPLLCSLSVFLSTPFIFFAIYLAPISPSVSWVFIAIGVTLLCVNWTLVSDMLLYIIVPHRRGLASAIQILVSHLFGDATSPFIVGKISDTIKASTSFPSDVAGQVLSLQYSLYTNCIVAILGGVAFLYNSYYIVRDKTFVHQ